MTTRTRSPRADRAARGFLSDRQIRTVLDAPEARVVLDAQGRIVLMNAAAEQLAGRVWSELAGLPIEQLVPNLQQALQRAPEAPNQTGEIAALTLHAADGAQLSVLVLLHRLRDPEPDAPPMRVVSLRPVRK